MGWFDEQIRQRIRADDENFKDAFASMAAVIMGRKALGAHLDNRKKTQNAIGEILNYYRVKTVELPEELQTRNEQLEYLLRPSGVMSREVYLEGTWYKDAVGAFLGKLKNGDAVALLPRRSSGYTYFDYKDGKVVKLNRHTAERLEMEATCFYKPLPLKKLEIRDLLIYIAQSLSTTDYVLVGVATLVVTLLGMLAPKLNSIVFSDVIKSGNIRLFSAVTVMLAASVIAGRFIETVKNILLERLQTKTETAVQAAAMMRVLSLPADFFKDYTAGEISNRIQSVNSLCSMLGSAFLTTGLTSVFSIIYITQLFTYAPSLAVPAILITLMVLLLTLGSTFLQMRQSKRIMELDALESGLTYSLIAGVQKLKLSGSEKRAFSKWAALYRQKAEYIYNPPWFLKVNAVLSTGISLTGTIVLYYMAIQSGVSVADYFAFNVAYGMVSGAFLSLSEIALTAAKIKPMAEMIKPILEAVPEVAADKKVLTRITGSIELNNVSFRYNKNMPLIVDNLSLKIRPGQYVALVGKTGCGKSTLMRLMLGLELPQKGAIYYYGKDLTKVDLKSLRRRIGVVMQNGKLFAGDIFSNIVISAPWLTMEEAWEAAELAGIAEDIRNMPMGMYTMISEGSGGISGGQRQRLMIARAIAAKPRILLFDEATSALDNLTQKNVAESLSKLKCTRIVIAHRLSTIKACDRIIVLDGGKVIEDGSYDELVSNNGYFAELVERQQLDDTQFVGKTTLF